MGNLSPRAIRERVLRTPRSSPLSSPAPPESPAAQDSGDSDEDDIDPEFTKFCQNFRTSTVPRMQELAARRNASMTTVAVPLDPLNEVDTPPHNNMTALDAHRLRESIVCKLSPDEAYEPFWSMATRVA